MSKTEHLRHSRMSDETNPSLDLREHFQFWKTKTKILDHFLDLLHFISSFARANGFFRHAHKKLQVES